MDNIHRVVYINLDHRTDRRQQVEEELLSKLRLPRDRMERFAAIRHANGLIGCGQSHLAVLRRAQRKGWPNVLILEDDFCATVDAAAWEERLGRFFARVQEYDVLMLAYNIPEEKADAARRPELAGAGVTPTQGAQTTSAYLAHRRFYPALIHNLEEGLRRLQRQPHVHWEFALDQYWKRLQPGARWYHAVPRLGFQRASFSDCANQFVDHGT